MLTGLGKSFVWLQRTYLHKEEKIKKMRRIDDLVKNSKT